MNKGGLPGAADGFTIVEVLIVLAVSSILLVSAAILVNGRQAHAEFTTGINDNLQQLQQIINETTSGYYPNNGDFSCSGSASGPVTFALTPSGSTSQGTNSGCMFLGKAIQFGVGTDSQDNSTLDILPIVGNQYQNNAGTLTPTLTVAASIPRAVYPANSGEYANVPTDILTQASLEYGLQLASGNTSCGLSTTAICYMPTSGGGYAPTGMAAFLAGDSSGNIATAASGSAGNLQSGNEPFSLYAVKKPSAMDISPEDASSDIGNLSRLTGLGNLDPAEEVLICVTDPGENESGLYTISNGLSVTLKVMSDSTC